MAVRDILVHTFDKLDKLHFEKLRELGSLDHPNGNILDYELLAENQSEELSNDEALYPSDQTPALESKLLNNNNSNLDLGDSLPPDLKSTQESPELIETSEKTSETINLKKNKPKVPPISIKTRSSKLKETLESDSESDSDIKKVTFDTNS